MKKEIIGDPIVLGGRSIPISQAVRAGDFLFISGQLGVDEEFKVVGDDIESQTRQALENLKARLKEGRSSPANVVKVTAWITHQQDFAVYNKVYAEVFGDAPPARSTVVSGLLVPGARVEIEAIAIAG